MSRGKLEGRFGRLRKMSSTPSPPMTSPPFNVSWIGDESPLADPPCPEFPLDWLPFDEAPFDEAPGSVTTSAARIHAGIVSVVHTCCDRIAIAARSRETGSGFQGAASPVFTIPLHFMACSTPP